MKNYFKPTFYVSLVLCSILMLSSCSKDDDTIKDDSNPDELLPAIVLECDYFKEDRVLKNDTLRPVDYVIPCWTTVNGNLKVEPGVVIAFENDAGMFIDMDNHIFEVKGTAENPVIFTGTSKQNGHWRGLYFSTAHNPNNKIEHTIIEYAGSEPLKPTSPVYEGSLAISGVSGTTPQALLMNHVKIRNSGNFGLDFSGLQTNANVTVRNLTLTENNGVAAKVTAEMAHIFDASSSYSGNEVDVVNIVRSYYEITQPVTWKNLDVPYLVDDRVHIKDGGHLTIAAGTELYFKPLAYLQASDGSTAGGNNLSLKVMGTATNPVLLSAANGTNWGGIYFGYTQEDNSISHAVIELAKGDFPVGNIENTGAIYMHASPKLAVANTLFKDLPNCAFYGYTTDPFENLTLSNVSFNNVGGELCEE
ncbi:hypothetical protein [Marixanthomonas spongiae]|uniref:Right-handed parallel beta-helix repeat-containing protein n=1 Tax=Marixanthomonas spongiae TaxID=2174845 RepID=A0A2U0I592_9FLAO|nr:hypothetical protein [Marixanthomonas spongiae]PVW16275.1 hypothetical protein DDV96_03120 [Marixanthomonas spongiae]